MTTSPEEAAEALRRGLLVALPTETVYGLGANAFDPRAVAGIFAVKERPAFDPLIVHLPTFQHVSAVATEVPPLARQLAKFFWPGPMTLVLPKSTTVPDLVTSGLPTVGVRIPEHPLMQRVLQLAGFPIAAPSANLFGRLSPTTADHVLEQLGDRIDLVLDGGPCRVGLESTILMVQGDQLELLRPGGIAVEKIEEMLGPVHFFDKEVGVKPIAPGQLTSHYAPQTRLELCDRLPPHALQTGCGGLSLRPTDLLGYTLVENLSATGDLQEAAANFFPALHRLDNARLQTIYAERFPNAGLGRALNDRLQRAAFRINPTKSS